MSTAESILDVAKKALPPCLWVPDNRPETCGWVLKETAEREIQKVAWDFRVFGCVSGVYIVGSMCTKQWTEESDIDVTVIMMEANDARLREAQKTAGALWDSIYLTGTKHPINPYVRRDMPLDLFDAVYDVENQTWLKQEDTTESTVPKKITEFDSLLKEIDLEKSQLHRDLIDYNCLLQLKPEDVSKLKEALEQRMQGIDRDVKKLALMYNTVHFLRTQGFKKTLTPLEIAQYKSRNQLPENVAYKLLEHYHYSKFLSAVSQALKLVGGEIKTHDDVATLKKQIGEITGSGAAGAYDVPLGASSFRRKKLLKRKQPASIIQLIGPTR